MSRISTSYAEGLLTNVSFCLVTCPLLTSIPFHLLLAEAVLLPPAGQHSHSPAPPLHPRGNGSGSDGAQSIQGEVDGAPGGCQVDRDDQVRLNGGEHLLFRTESGCV